MQKAEIIRIDRGDEGSFGVFIAEGFTCRTGELPWRCNALDISCVYAGEYDVIWTFSNAFQKEMYLLVNVEGRTGIRIHVANLVGDVNKTNPKTNLTYESEVRGCIAPGLKTGIYKGQKAILSSGPALEQLEDVMNREPFKLSIREAYDWRTN